MRARQPVGPLLRAAGVGPEVLVGLCVERSVEMMVAVLGILKAGGAFVPLNPLYPQERLSFMIGDAGLSLLLTEQVPAGATACCQSCGRCVWTRKRLDLRLSRRRIWPAGAAPIT